MQVLTRGKVPVNRLHPWRDARFEISTLKPDVKDAIGLFLCHRNTSKAVATSLDRRYELS